VIVSPVFSVKAQATSTRPVRVLRDERGQNMVEYVIMAGIFALILVWFAKAAPIAVNAYYQYFAYVLQAPFP